MISVSQLFLSRWRSLRHLGAAKPYQKVEIRYGRFERDYRAWAGPPMPDIQIPGRSTNYPWTAYWVPDGEWVEMPNVMEFETRQSFDDDGIQSFTLTVENVTWQPVARGEKFYHVLLRGFMSPFRGYQSRHRPKQATIQPNEWHQYLSRACQIRVWQGYGPDTAVPVFVGLTDADDYVALPDRITITGRDFGQVLQDSRAFGWNIDRHFARFPPVFFDRRKAHGFDRVGTAGPDDCSTRGAAGGPPRVADDDPKTYWVSGNNRLPGQTEYVQVRLPAGKYEEFEVHPLYAGMEMYVSVYARGDDIRIDGVHQPDGWEGWVDLGKGDVPGATHGGNPYMKRWGSVAAVKRTYKLGARVKCGNNSVLRVSFRNLRKRYVDYNDPDRNGVVQDGDVEYTYRAGVRSLQGWRRDPFDRVPEAKKKGYVLVDDVSDVVRVVLRWAGFKEWDIENTGMRLQEPLVFSNGDFLVDLIRKCQEMTGFTFFMGGPSRSDEVLSSPDKDEYSIGVPVFRRPHVIQTRPRPGEPVQEVRDIDLLTGMQFRYDDETLPYIIRIRGKNRKKEKGGIRLGVDRTRRLQAQYNPVWARERDSLAGVARHFTKTYHHLTSQLQCEVMARYVAVVSALAATTTTIEVPCNPSIWIDQHLGVRDVGTGLNTRVYLSNRTTHFRSGANATWTMTLGGALIDVPNVQDELAELESVLALGEPDHVYPPMNPTPSEGSAVAGVAT